MRRGRIPGYGRNGIEGGAGAVAEFGSEDEDRLPHRGGYLRTAQGVPDEVEADHEIDRGEVHRRVIDEPLRPHLRCEEVPGLLGVEQAHEHRAAQYRRIRPERGRDLERDGHCCGVVARTRHSFAIGVAGVVVGADEDVPIGERARPRDRADEVGATDVGDLLEVAVLTGGFDPQLLQTLSEIPAGGQSALPTGCAGQAFRGTEVLDDGFHDHSQ